MSLFCFDQLKLTLPLYRETIPKTEISPKHQQNLHPWFWTSLNKNSTLTLNLLTWCSINTSCRCVYVRGRVFALIHKRLTGLRLMKIKYFFQIELKGFRGAARKCNEMDNLDNLSFLDKWVWKCDEPIPLMCTKVYSYMYKG